MNMERVLVVDDAPIVRRYHRQILESAGFAVEEAENGVRGLELALATRHHAYLVDVNMPMMDGFAFVRALRANDETRAVPVIMISTEAGVHDKKTALGAGANVFLVKPVRPADLMLHLRLLTGARP